MYKFRKCTHTIRFWCCFELGLEKFKLAPVLVNVLIKRFDFDLDTWSLPTTGVGGAHIFVLHSLLWISRNM